MSYRHVIRQGDFSKLWLSQMLSLVAQNLLNFTLIIRVFDLTQGTRFANIAVSILILSFGIPSILFAAVAGVYVDHWDRRRVLIIANLLRALLVLNYFWAGDNFGLLLVLTFLISTITQFFTPAEAAAIPKLVRREHLISANALFVSTIYASFIIGYSLAAPIIRGFGDEGPFFVAAVLFFVATSLAIWLPRLGEGHRRQATFRQLFLTTHSEIARNTRLILGNVNLYFPILQLMLIQVMIGVMMVLAPALSLALLKVPLPDASHLLILPAALGMLIGVVSVSRIAKHISKLRLISTSLLVAGSALTVLGLSGLLYRTFKGQPIAATGQIGLIAAATVFVLGLASAVISVTAQTLLQENSTDDTRGKIFGALNMMVNLAATLPILVAGILADALSVTKVISLTGLGIVLFATYQYFAIRRPLSVVQEDAAKTS